MFARKIRRSLSPLLTGALLTAACLTPVRAEVILQGSSTPLPGPAITVNGNVGQTRGNNLFHSFSVFNILRAGPSASGRVVPAQESVTFTSPTGGGSHNKRHKPSHGRHERIHTYKSLRSLMGRSPLRYPEPISGSSIPTGSFRRQRRTQHNGVLSRIHGGLYQALRR